jgi:ABC-type transport system substrate-binding protein
MISVKRRGLALLGVLALVAGACGGTTASQSPAGSGQPAATGGTAEVGDFKFVTDSEPTTLATEPDDLPTSWITAQIYSALYQPNYKLEYVPLVAESAPDISSDGLTWTIKLRKGVLFHDGTELTSADVKFSYDLHVSENCRGNPDLCSAISDNVTSVTAPDPSTVVFKLKQKYAPFLSAGLSTVFLLPKAAVEASFAKFQQAAGAVAKAEVEALSKKVSGATATEDAAGKETPCADAAKAPATCKFSTYTGEIEALLAKASIEPLNKAQFNTGGESGTEFDPEAYAQGIFGQVSDLERALTASSIDQIAAAQKLIDFGKHPIGTGQYKFVKYSAGQNVELARWDKYFGGTTKVDPNKVPAKAFAVVIRGCAAGATALGNDEIQWQQKIECEAWKTVKDKVQMAEYPDNGYYYIGFNLRQGHIYADKPLREAFSMCIDHSKTIEAATKGNGVPVYANTPPFSWAYNPNVPKYTLDVAGAKAKIEGAGWKLGSDGIYAKGGKRLSSILYVRVGRPERLAFAQLARDQLKECGIEIKVQEGDLNTVLIPKVLDYPNDFDTYLGGWSTALDPDDYSIFNSGEIPTKAKPSANNFPGWKNAQADTLLKQGREEFDQAKRTQIYAQFQTLIHGELPYYFLWADKAHTGLSKRVVSQNEPLDLTTTAINYYNIDAWTVAR